MDTDKPVFENSIAAIKAYFGSDIDAAPQTIETKEFKDMNGEERKELAIQCAARLGGVVK